MAQTLTVHEGSETRSFTLDRPLTLGRSEDNAVVMPGAAVSRHHGIISPSPDGAVYMDLGSANGSRLRGIEIEPRSGVVLHPGDSLEIGQYSVSVGEGPGPSAAQTRVGAPVNAPAPAQTMLAAQVPMRLEITEGGRTREVTLSGDVLSVGREEGNNIVIPSSVVSRRHLILRRLGATYIVEDQGTTNGIRFRGEKVSAHTVADGDTLDIANEVALRFRTGPAMPAVEVVADERPLSLAGSAELVIGRSADCQVRVDHPMVSLRHARVAGEAAQRFIEDLGSTNGTYVNGARVPTGARAGLTNGDVIQVGPVRLLVEQQQLRRTSTGGEIGLTVAGLNQRVAPTVNLLQDLWFVINPQEFVAVVGVSGAGKSTLLGALSGFRPASHGEVYLNHVSLYSNFDAFRTTLGYVPQDDILHKELPVGSALAYSAALRLPNDTSRREREGRVESVISQMGLQERRDVPVGRLSGGQRKRVSIGAELLTQPGLFFLDEATSGLDPGTESQLMRLLRKLADDGRTIILITHATKNVMLCDQVVFLAKGGHLAYFGPPDQALAYFSVQDFDGIYEKLESESTPVEWANKYKQSQQYREFVVQRLADQGLAVGGGISSPSMRPTGAPPADKGSASAFRQLTVLARRYIDIIRRDRINLMLLFLLAPALGLIDFVTWDRNILSRESGDATRAMTMLFLSSLIPFLVGSLSFVREIVKEAPIYARERAVSLRIWPYLGSKIAVAVPLALYHAGALFVIKYAAVEFPGVSALDLGTLYFTLVLAVVSGVLWALLISTITAKEEQAMLLVIGLVIFQMVFSGGLVSLSSLGPAGTIVGGATSTSWTFKAMAASSGLSTDGCAGDFDDCDLPGISGLQGEPERALTYNNVDKQFGDVLDANVYVCWGAMIAIIAVLSAVLYVLQRRKDTL